MAGPEIRQFQFAGNNVNLFRGDVNTSINIFQLPSRNNLDLSFTIQYQSNVHDQANLWNLDAPTGILGLGWSTPFESIELLQGGSTSHGTRSYMLNSMPLLTSEEPWKLFDIINLTGTLVPGQVFYALREQFALNSCELSEHAVIIADEENWIVKDAEFERDYLIKVGALLEVYDYGEGYELKNYQFWKIRYYPDYEKWLVVKETGVMSIYGGLSSQANNSLQWGVKWDNWIGSSTLAEGQTRYAVKWNLASNRNLWGDAVHYNYEVVEQKVGKDGISYTKACYLKSITDAFGRKVNFYYKEKSPGEFMDPHKPVPDNTPNAYQDKYETQYLAKIDINNPEGDLLMSFEFISSVYNVTDRVEGDELYAETSKRFLTNIIQKNTEGNSLPGIAFDYYFSNTDANPGALKTITTPQGGISKYYYRNMELPICKKDLKIERPSDFSVTDWRPRIWYGNDYAVVIWFNLDNRHLRAKIYSWIGYWYEWSDERLDFQGDIELDSLSVIAGNTSCGIYYNNAQRTKTELLLMHKLENSAGMWMLHPEKLSYTYEYAPVEISGGNDFFNVFIPDEHKLDTYTWNWRSGFIGMEEIPWQKTTTDLNVLFNVSGTPDYYIASQSNYYIILCYETNTATRTLKLFYLDGLSVWQTGGTEHPNISISSNANNNFFWTLSESFAVATCITNTSSSFTEYDLHIFHWNEAYQFSNSFLKKGIRIERPLQFVAAVKENKLIGFGPHLYRYNGQDWQNKSLDLKLPTAAPGNIFWFSYGPDLALLTENSNTQVITRLSVYDPDTDTLQWNTAVNELVNTRPSNHRTMDYYPTSGIDYLSVGEQVFFRGTSNNWVTSVEHPIYQIQNEIVNTTTIYNQAPSFFCCLEYENNDGILVSKGTRIFNLENGSVKNTEFFSESIFTVYKQDGYAKSDINGSVPTGYNALVTYSPVDGAWDNADSITLRRALNAALEGVVVDRSVCAIEVDDGFDKVYSSYAYDLDTAACDPDGKVVKYYRALTYSGSVEASAGKDGYTETIYINGLPGNTPKINYAAISEINNIRQNYTVLDGYIEVQNSYNAKGTLVQSQRNDWLVKTHKHDRAGNKVHLRSAYVLLTKNTDSTDGLIANHTINTYDLFSGKIIKSLTTNYNARGNRETWCENTLYSYSVYPLLAGLNDLSSTCGSNIVIDEEKFDVKQNKIESTQATFGASVSRLKLWERKLQGNNPPLFILATNDNIAWLGGNMGINFTAWEENADWSGNWQLQQKIISRANNGLVTEMMDVTGRFSSYLYDKDARFPVATFSNARITKNQVDYLGFENYESGAGWHMSSGESWRNFLKNDNSHTGVNSLCLAKDTTGDNAFEKTFNLSVNVEKYLITYWYKTQDTFIDNPELSGWEIVISRAGDELNKIMIGFENTHGDWAYVSHPIDLHSYNPGDSNPIELTLRAYNKTIPYVLLDNIRFSPFLCSFSATVYNDYYNVKQASLGPNAETNRVIYDNFHSTIASVGPAENVTTIAMEAMALQIGKKVDVDNPNAVIAISTMEGGFYSDFQRDGGYSKHWQTSQNGDWVVNAGKLVHEATSKGEINLKNPIIDTNYAVYFNVTALGSTLSGNLGFIIGDNLTIAWNNTDLRFQLVNNNYRYESKLGLFGSLPEKWLLYLYENVLVFFADGQKVFAQSLTDKIKGSFSFFTYDRVAFSNILLARKPQLSISYVDGNEKERQSQVLSGYNSIISQQIYDSLGRAAVATKPAKLSPNETCPLLSYRKEFVTSLDWDTGIMLGEVSDYYSLTGDGGTDDENYPYTRTRFESSPLSRPIESGLPGKDFAISNISSSQPSERKTTKIIYTTNNDDNLGFMDWLPKNRYYLTQIIDADGNVSVSMQDQNKNTVGQGALIDKVNSIYNLSTSEGYISNFDKISLTKLPNYYDADQVAYKTDWQSSITYNMLGRVIKSFAPNDVNIEHIYDVSGLTRFSQDTRGRAEGYYYYSKYDVLDRVVEFGIIRGEWNHEVLQQYAMRDPNWPADNPTWNKRYYYDGDGTDPKLMLRLVSVSHRGDLSATSLSNEEALNYNIYGAVISHELIISATAESYKTYYEYDNQGNLTKITYPKVGDTDDFSSCYFYNQLGQLSSVGASLDEPDKYEVYHYHADGSLKSKVTARGMANEITRNYRYISPGWIKEISDSMFKQINYYNKDKENNDKYYTGLIAGQDFELFGGSNINITKQYSYNYTYDNIGQLISAENSINGLVNPNNSIGLNDHPLTYDHNGNIKSLQAGEVLKNYAYFSGTDEVKNTDGTEEQNFTYNEDGALTTATTLGIQSIVYNEATGRVDKIETTHGSISYQYNADNQRIKKSAANQTKFYLHGINSNPLRETIQTAGNIETKLMTYIYGINGVIGYIKDNQLNIVLTDQLGSTRAILDAQGNLNDTYTYLPFGGFMDNPELLGEFSYLYTSQEWEDELGLYNYKSRFYDPTLGRFISIDPAGEFASPYIYVGNNPIMFTDPSGNISNSSMRIAGITLGAASLAVGIGFSVATLGVSSLGVTAALIVLGGAAAGAGASSLVYSASHKDNWDAKDFAIQFGIGLGAGALTSAIGMGVGAATSSAVRAMSVSIKSAAAMNTATFIVSPFVDAAINVGLTATYNQNGYDLGMAAIQGFVGGLIASNPLNIRSGSRASTRYKFSLSNNAKELFRNGEIPGGHIGACGIYNVKTGKIDVEGAYQPGNGKVAPYGTAHLEMANALYGPSNTTRHTAIGVAAVYDDLRGFSVSSINGVPHFRSSSTSLNQHRPGSLFEAQNVPPPGIQRHMSPQHFKGVLMAASYESSQSIALDTIRIFYARYDSFLNDLNSPWSHFI